MSETTELTNGYTTLDELMQLEGRRVFEDVEIPHPFEPEHQLRFRIRSLVEDEWSEIQTKNLDKKRGGLSENGLKASDARLVAMSLVDADGQLLYTGREAHKRIGTLSSAIVEPLVRACRKLNGLRSADDEDEEGNSQNASD